MKGLSLKIAQTIERLIKNKFDNLSLDLLGFKPKLNKEKRITFSSSKNSILSLFLGALDSKSPTKSEEQILKLMLSVANGYVNALRDKTISKVLNDVNGYYIGRNINQKNIETSDIVNIIEDNMDKAKNHFKMIANSESNKAINTGSALQITKMSEQKGEEDPTVFFIVTVDDKTGPEEFVLHLLPDKVTPRLWKLSEVENSYHKIGDSRPKVQGLHPHCRCKITYLAKGWGFDNSGHIKYISPDHDELKEQRKHYGLPR